MGKSSKPEPKWVFMGPLSAGDCFNCRNMMKFEIHLHNVKILCKDPCNFIPMQESKLHVDAPRVHVGEDR
jgi:hypothetical protein